MGIATTLLVLAGAGALVAEPPLSADPQDEELIIVGSRFFEHNYGDAGPGYGRGYPPRPPGYLDWPGHHFEYFQPHRRQHPLIDSHRHHRLRRPHGLQLERGPLPDRR